MKKITIIIASLLLVITAVLTYYLIEKKDSKAENVIDNNQPTEQENRIANNQTAEQGLHIFDSKEFLSIPTNNQTAEQWLLYEYKENSDGTWSANNQTYKNKVILTGVLPSSDKITTYVVLTNDKIITFNEVAKSFVSSNSSDLLDPQRACVVEMK